jgi:UDP-N-acetylmuramyl tripeptide synthase
MGNKLFSVRMIFTLGITKILIKFLRLLTLGGTTLPGRVAKFMIPDILKILPKKLDKIIIVTGTNGKTTTCRIIGKLLSESGINYFTNKSGANLQSGILTTLIENTTFNGNFAIPTALFEVDEAAFSKITNYMDPDFVVITNFFRDQLDRYGELYTTVQNVEKGIKNTTNTTLIVNGDDSLCSSIVKNTQKDAYYFGFSKEISQKFDDTTGMDALFCIYCKYKYEYTFRTFGHLGDFICPSCGFGRQNPDVFLSRITSLTTSKSEISIKFSETNNEFDCQINLPGLYNIYNSLAAATLGHAMEIPAEKIKSALENFECGFGRMETIESDGKYIKVILVKNPTGFNQVINYLLTEEKNTNIAFLINDNAADGTDISWLWDVDFEKFEVFQDKISSFFTSGKRCNDMALRLKYAGVYKNKIEVCQSFDKLLELGLSKTAKGQNFYILPTYTALLDIRNKLRKKFNLKEFWK